MLINIEAFICKRFIIYSECVGLTIRGLACVFFKAVRPVSVNMYDCVLEATQLLLALLQEEPLSGSV